MNLSLAQTKCGRKSVFRYSIMLAAALLPIISACKFFGQSSDAAKMLGEDTVSFDSRYDDIDPEYMTWSTIYAYPNFVLQGQPVTLYWHAPMASRVEINGVPGTFPGRFGSVIVYPQASQDYTLTAYNSKTSISGFVNVTVFPYPGAVTSFWGEPSAITPGMPAVLRWRAENCDYVEVREDVNPTPIYSGRCLLEDSVRVQPSVRTRYMITAFRNYSGPGTAGGNIATNFPPTIVGRSDTAIDIVDKVPEISLTANTNTVREGQQVYLNWTVQDGENISFEPAIVSSPGPSGSTSFVATKTKTYRLVAYSKVNRQRFEKEITINVVPSFRINQLLARPEILQKGTVGSIVWSTSQCRRVWVTKVSGERVSIDLNCNNAVEIRPSESTQYIVHFEYEDQSSEDLRIQEIPVQVTVIGDTEKAVPIATPALPPPAPAPALAPTPNPQSTPSLATSASKSPEPVFVPNRREAPRIVIFNSNKYSTWSDEPIIVHWKAVRAKRVILQAGGQSYVLEPRGKKELLLKNTEKISLVAENDKYRTTPIEIEIKVSPPLNSFLKGTKP